MLFTVAAIWKRVTLLTCAVSTALHLVCGIVATSVHLTGPKATRSPRWALAVLVAPIVGAISAFILAAIPTFLIAAVYENIGASMSPVASLGWGLGQGVFIVLVNAGAFQRVV